MKQVSVTYRNGIQLPTAETVALEFEKVVTTKNFGFNQCEIVYAGTIDRRVAPISMVVNNHKGQIDGYVTGSQIDLTVYELATGATSTLTVTEKFIEQAVEATMMINNTATACRQVTFRKGAFTQDVIYVSTTLAGIATAALTTTTTTAAITTTTTRPVTTTTTTSA